MKNQANLLYCRLLLYQGRPWFTFCKFCDYLNRSYKMRVKSIFRCRLFDQENEIFSPWISNYLYFDVGLRFWTRHQLRPEYRHYLTVSYRLHVYRFWRAWVKVEPHLSLQMERSSAGRTLNFQMERALHGKWIQRWNRLVATTKVERPLHWEQM